MACAESTKAHNEYRRKQRRLAELASPEYEALIRKRIARLPKCRVCHKPLVLEERGVHAACSSIREAYGYQALGKKTKVINDGPYQ